jgi:hypothetical protein
MHRAFVLAAVIASVPAAMPAQGVAGHWSATFDADVSVSGENMVVKGRRPAALDLTARGDSVFGKWIVADLETVSVSGTFDGRVLRLTSGVHEREMRINGQATKVKTRIDWTAAVAGNTLDGTMFIRLGDREPPPRRWEAKR